MKHLSTLQVRTVVAFCVALFCLVTPSNAQTDDPLRDAESCFRAEVAALFTGSVWQSTGAGVTSVAEFKQNGQYAIAAYMGTPDGSPDMAFDGTWSIVGEQFIAVEMMGTESFYVIAEDLQFIMNNKEVLFRLASAPSPGAFSGRTLKSIRDGCTQTKLSDAGAPAWTGVYEGTQPGYPMRNDNGEIVRIAGRTIDIPAVRHEFTLGPESALMTQTALDEDGRTYRYVGEYLNHDIGPGGEHSFKIAFTDNDGSEPIGMLFQTDADHFRVLFSDNAPEFTVERTSPAPTAAAPEPAQVLMNAVILEGKQNVNVRATPPSGSVVTTVDGGQVFPVHEIREMSDPIHLLAEQADLHRVDESGTITKAANHKLENIADAGGFCFADVADDSGRTVRVIVPRELISIRRDAWYRSDALGGWVFSGLCRENEPEHCSH